MHITHWILWGFIATLLLTTIMALAQELRLTRMSLPLILGTMFTSNRDTAKIIGFCVHLVNGWVFAFVYVAVFESLGYATWYLGALNGFIQAIIILTIVVPLVPGIHPRMASEHQSPVKIRQLEPPGFLCLHYGIQTPVSVIVAHIVYGAILGAFYEFV